MEAIANAYEGKLFDNANLLDETQLLESLTLADVQSLAEALIQSEGISVFDVLPTEDTEDLENS